MIKKKNINKESFVYNDNEQQEDTCTKLKDKESLPLVTSRDIGGFRFIKYLVYFPYISWFPLVS